VVTAGPAGADAAGATVAGATVGEAVASNYGDFYVDKLEPGREYTVTVSAPGYVPVTSTVRLDKSLNLGTIVLAKL
jgi:hypothetical protein